MKKNYEAPSLEITKFETEDILNGSVITGTGTELNPGVSPGFPNNSPVNPT